MPKTSFTLPALIFSAAALLSACDVAYPVTVIGPDGTTFRGSATDTVLRGGSFFATNGPATCTGTYDKIAENNQVSFPVTCNNGLRGIGTAFFETHTNGSGLVTMNDGSRWQFIFGNAALQI